MEKEYLSNKIRFGERVFYALFSILLFMYGSFSVWIDDLFIPGKRSNGVHLHGTAAWLMYSAIICACLVMLSIIADHYGTRDNEISYRRFAMFFGSVGGVFAVLPLILMFVSPGLVTRN